MKLRYIIIFFVFSFAILFPFIISKTVMNGNDLNGNIVPLLYFKESILTYHVFPLWNPYIDQGIPAVADPLYGVYNPIISIPILFFDYQIAIKVMYFLSIFISCITMFVLLKLFKIKNVISVLIAITYASNSYVYSRIVAGHLEKIVSFAFLPLFIFCLIKTFQTQKILWSGLTAITISLILFSGDIYNAMYCLYSLSAIILWSIFKKRQSFFFLLLTLILFFLFSSIKIFPMIELQSYISKIKEPFNGGLSFLTFITNLFFPFNNLLSRMFQTSDLSTGYGWWESLSFIGPFSVLGIYFLIKSIFTKKYAEETSFFLVLSILYLMLAMPGSTLNPYHYLISSITSLQYFHVPSRILAFWSVLVLINFAIFLSRWKRRKLAAFILCINLFIVYIFSQNVLLVKDFYRNLNGYDASFIWIKNNNPYSFYVLHGTSQSDIPHDKAYLSHLLMLQSNYGLFLRGSLAEKYNFKGLNTYKDLKPGFIIANEISSDSHLEEVKRINDKIIYKDPAAISFAMIDSQSQRAYFSPNKISIKTNSQTISYLNLLESNYPGWSAYTDGMKTKILPGRFLKIKIPSGNHKYEFVFTSKPFMYGLLISLSSLSLWGFYIFYKCNIVRKKGVKKG